MSYIQKLPFADVVTKSLVVTSAAVTQMISRVPWQPGAQKHYTLRKVIVTSTVGSGNTVTLWDQDLSSATPATRGNASTGALFTVSVPAAGVASATGTTVRVGLDECPRVRFEAGICAQSTLLNTAIILELEVN